jgi:hypothetical protein
MLKYNTMKQKFQFLQTLIFLEPNARVSVVWDVSRKHSVKYSPFCRVACRSCSPDALWTQLERSHSGGLPPLRNTGPSVSLGDDGVRMASRVHDASRVLSPRLVPLCASPWWGQLLEVRLLVAQYLPLSGLTTSWQRGLQTEKGSWCLTTAPLLLPEMAY